jgi:hypothetical protein
MVHRLIYRSVVARPVRFQDVEAIAEISAKNNSKVGVSGMLVYTPSHFLQVLEGEKDAVEKVYSRVKKDPRHHMVQTLATETAAERAFGNWGMRATMPTAELGASALERITGPAALELMLQLRG